MTKTSLEVSYTIYSNVFPTKILTYSLLFSSGISSDFNFYLAYPPENE